MESCGADYGHLLRWWPGIKNLPSMWETQVRSLSQEDPLEEGMATHCSALAWRIPWKEEPGGLQSLGSQRVRHNRVTKHTHTHTGIQAPERADEPRPLLMDYIDEPGLM